MHGLREAEVFLSVVAVIETERGVRQACDADFAAALTTWLENLFAGVPVFDPFKALA